MAGTREQQLVEGIVTGGADHEVERPQVSAQGILLEYAHAVGQLDRLIGDRPFRHPDVGIVALPKQAMAVRRSVA